MGTSFDEVFDFDINFLPQPNQNVVNDNRLDKQRKAVLIAKKKTIATDSLIKKYYAKKETLEQTELMLLTAKEECKRVCIDYKNTLEKCTGLEKDIQTLKDNYGLLQAQYTQSQNEHEAITSHANQLQSLVEENELKIVSLQIEKQIGEKKKEKENNDVSEKTQNSFQKQNETLLRHILILKDIVLGKRKLQKHHKILLHKYEKAKLETNDDDRHDGNYSSDETDFFEECSPPALDAPFEKPLENKNSQTETYSIFKENNVGLCRTSGTNGAQEFENDSEDTGRGSSLAFSDGGKFFNSPDYYGQDSPPIEVDQSKVCINKTFTDASTSPAYSVDEKATSPLIFDNAALHTDVPLTSSSENIITDIPISSDIVTTKEKLKLVDHSTSPICDVERKHVACSPVTFIDSDSLSNNNEESIVNHKKNQEYNSPRKLINKAKSVGEVQNYERNKIDQEVSLFNDVSQSCIQEISSTDLSQNELEICDKNDLEKICLEKHNSDNLTHKGNDDSEIEMILSSMRLDHSLLTPIPFSPSKSKDKTKNKAMSLSPKQHPNENHIKCIEAAKLREDNKVLAESIANLSKELTSIKSLQEKNLLINISLLNHINNERDPCQSKNKTKLNIHNIEILDRNMLRNLDEQIYSENLKSQNQPSQENSLCNVRKTLNTVNNDINLLDSVNEDVYLVDKVNEGVNMLAKVNDDVNLLDTVSNDETLLDAVNEDVNLLGTVNDDENLSDTVSNDEALLDTVNEDVNLLGTVNDDENLPDTVSNDEALLDTGNEDVNLLGTVNDDENLPDTVSNDETLLDTVNEDVNLLGTVNDDENLPLSHFIPKKMCKTNDGATIKFESKVTHVDNGNHYKIIESCGNKTKKCKGKLSKLQKIRNKMLPKYKIAENKFLNRKISRKNLTPIVVIRNKAEMDKILYNKLAHEKAIKILAEAKSKENKKDNSKRKQLNNTKDHKNNTKSSTITNLQINEENVILGSVNNINIKHVISEEKFNETKQKTLNSIRKSIENVEETKQKLVDSIRKSVEISQSTIETSCESPPSLVKSNMRTTRSRSKLFDSESAVSSPSKLNIMCTNTINNQQTDNIHINNTFDGKSPGSRKGYKRPSNEVPQTVCKRILRSSKIKESIIESSNIKCASSKIITTSNMIKNINNSKNKDISNIFESNINNNITTKIDVDKKKIGSQNKRDTNETHSMQAVEYSDLDMFSTSENYFLSDQNNCQSELNNYPNSILCKTIDTYKIKTKKNYLNKKIDQVSNTICKKLEEDIASIIESPADKHKQGMNKLVEDLQKFHVKSFISGFMKYLKQPARKLELFKTVNAPPAPLMTNAEQILLYVIKDLRFDNQDIIKFILENIEYTLFQLNRTPEFDVVESMSHFYAIVCKYFGLKNRLRMFLLDAMYCLSYKVTTVVKQCLSVWMHILPLAHMGIAKNPLVTCLVYLLHFYKCEDRFKRVQDIRYILQHKFFYQIAEWNDTKIIEMFKNAIKEIREIPVEKKILRMALIILGKRQGPTWCDKNIINNMLLPIITKENVPNLSKEFAVSMLGPLLKPFPVHMKLSCETVVNRLLDMLDKNPLDSMKEAIFTSLIYMSKHNQYRVTQALLVWEPQHISADFKKHLKNYVREKSPRTWTKLIPELLIKYQLSDNAVY